jgi:protein phosphatase
MAGETQIIVPAVDVAVRSDPGRDPTKQVNEDASGWRETPFGVLGVVCDGMGGHVGGREASNAALSTIVEAFERAPPGTPARDVLRDAIRLANVRVRGLALSEPSGGRPGSTVVAVLVHGLGTEVAHVGDSRAYFVHQGQIFQITRDHSMVQEMVEAKILTPAQAAVHPEANKITRALGIDDDVEVDLRQHPLAHVAGDTFVLCSDGLSDLVEPPEILKIVSTDPPAQAVGKLVELANARGGHDNVTVMVLRPRSSAPQSSTIALSPTLADEEPAATLRPPQAPIIIPSKPLPPILLREPPAPTLVTQKKPGPPPAVVAAVIVVLAVVAIVFARSVAHHEGGGGRAVVDAATDAEGAPAGSVSSPFGPRGVSSVVLEPVAPPDAGEVDASEITPLAPSSGELPRHQHNRH